MLGSPLAIYLIEEENNFRSAQAHFVTGHVVRGEIQAPVLLYRREQMSNVYDLLVSLYVARAATEYSEVRVATGYLSFEHPLKY